jgi:hypothetical protein
MSPELVRKVYGYRLDAYSIIDELRWYFYLLDQGYSKKNARKHALYYLLPTVIDTLEFESA